MREKASALFTPGEPEENRINPEPQAQNDSMWELLPLVLVAVATLVVGVLAVARGVSSSLHPAQAQGCSLCPAGQGVPFSD